MYSVVESHVHTYVYDWVNSFSVRIIFLCIMQLLYVHRSVINLLQQIFVDPLRKVTSSSTVNDLLKHCVTPEQRRFFQALGMCVGNERWAEDRRTMLQQARLEGEEVSTGVKSKHAPLVDQDEQDMVCMQWTPNPASFKMSDWKCY